MLCGIARSFKDRDTLLKCYGFEGFPDSIAFFCLMRLLSYELQGDDFKRRQ